MKLTTIMDHGGGLDGAMRYWCSVVEDDGGGDVVNRFRDDRLPVAYVSMDCRSEKAAQTAADEYIKRHGK